MRERLRNYRLLLRWLPMLLTNRETRQLLREMMAFVRGIPQVMKQPLPAAMQEITPEQSAHAPRRLGEQALRDLADLAAVLERRSVPGICLKRSLVRYHYLSQIGVPLEIVFGARFVAGEKKNDVTGHAWLEQAGQVYWESAENVTPFTPIYRYSPSDAIG